MRKREEKDNSGVMNLLNKIKRKKPEIRKERPKTNETEEQEKDQAEMKSNLDTLTSAYDLDFDPSPFSRVRGADLEEFATIISLDDLAWLSSEME